MSDEFPFTLLAPPEALPEEGEIDEDKITYIGRTIYVSGMYKTRDKFGLQRKDRKRHMYILGKSGMGKTYFMEGIIRSDIRHGFGLAVIDPHQDLALGLLESIPGERVDDVVYVDPSNTKYPLIFNPFANVSVEHRQRVAQGLVEIFKKQFASTWTPQIEHLFRFATLAMLEYTEGTLYGVLRIITDAGYRQQVLSELQDDVIKRFFSVEFAGYSQKYEQAAVTPLTNRLGHFFSDPLMRSIFSNPDNDIDIEEIMNNEKILIINTAKGMLGEENSALFGSFFLTKIEQAAMARSQLPQSERKEFYLYVDEFQNVATESFIPLFSESRKYGINITVANQYLGQISDSLINAILGNVGTMVIFRIGGADAKRIALEFQPELKSDDFLSLGVGEFYIKMSIDGKTAKPFSATSLKLMPAAFPESRDKIVSRERHSPVGAPKRPDDSYDFIASNDIDSLPPPV